MCIFKQQLQDVCFTLRDKDGYLKQIKFQNWTLKEVELFIKRKVGKEYLSLCPYDNDILDIEYVANIISIDLTYVGKGRVKRKDINRFVPISVQIQK